MKLPRVSVIITAFNYAHTVGAAIESALAQDWRELEVLVLDNASTDATPEVLAAYASDPRVRYHRRPVNIGMMANHNAGLKQATGEYIVYLSADDVLMPGHITTQYWYQQQHPDIDVTFTPLYLMNSAGYIIERRHGELLARYHGRNNPFASLFAFGCDMCMPTMLVPRRIYDRFGGFNEDFVGADYEMFVRWAAGGVRFAYLPEPLAAFRTHTGQRSGAEKYLRTGEGAHEYLRMLELHVDAATLPMLAGYEHCIIRNMRGKYDRAKTHGFAPDPALEARIDKICLTIAGAKARHDAASFDAKICVVVVADDSLRRLGFSLQSLVEQEFEDWEALVVAPDHAGLDAFCRRIDPRGRIRTVTPYKPVNLSIALNTAACVSDANAFAFLRAGSSYPPDHLHKLQQAFAHPDVRVAVSRTRLVVPGDDGNETYTEFAFPDDRLTDAIVAAPSYSLESLAFKRNAVDESLYFNEDIADFCQWDLLIRLRRLFPVFHLHSFIEVRERVGAAPLLRAGPQTLEAARIIFTFYTVESPDLQQLRVRYLERLAARAATVRDINTGIDDIVEFYQDYSGYSLLAPAAAG